MPGTERLYIRVTPESKDLIELGAKTFRMSITAFVLAGAEQLAKQAIAGTAQAIAGTAQARRPAPPTTPETPESEELTGWHHSGPPEEPEIYWG